MELNLPYLSVGRFVMQMEVLFFFYFFFFFLVVTLTVKKKHIEGEGDIYVDHYGLYT